jgi:hypothetical protein
MPKKIVKREMVEFAQKKGWSTSMAAKQFEFSREAIQHACEKFCVYLDGDPPKTKKFSVSMASVENYIKKQQKEKEAKNDN